MIPVLENPAFQRKAAILLGSVTFLSFLFFYEGGGWNQNSRFDLLRAIVERHTLQIDAYHENTQDKAHFRGHYYSDKAPGAGVSRAAFCGERAGCVANRRNGSRVATGRDCGVVPGERRCDCVAHSTGGSKPVFSGDALRRWSERGGIGNDRDVPGDADMGVCEFVLGACFGGSLPGVCFLGGVKGEGQHERARGLSLGAGGGTRGGLGYGYGVSCRAGLGDAGGVGAVAGMAARDRGALAG